MKVLTFDLETECFVHNKRKAGPFDPRNYIVEAGWCINGGPVESKRFDVWHRESIMDEAFDSLESGDVINLYNAKFDLLWVWGQESLRRALKRGVTIWCGQYAEYLINGMTQENQMCAMNDIAQKYGGGSKVDAVKELWEAGYLTSQIPPDLLHDYLCGDGDAIVGDVHNTWKIYCGQVNYIKENMPKAFIPMIKWRMDGLLATTEMEHNGLYIDREVGEAQRVALEEEFLEVNAKMEQFIPETPPEFEFNWGSGVHKSALIFGGWVKYQKWAPHLDDEGNPLYAQKKEKWPLFNNVPVNPEECTIGDGGLYIHGDAQQDTYKSGKQQGEGKAKAVTLPDPTKPKGAITDFYLQFPGYVRGKPQWKLKTTDAKGGPLYGTGSDNIEELGAEGLEFTNVLLRRASIQKDLGTYYWREEKGVKKGMLTLVGDDGIIHHKLNHTSTVTGRLSSSDPNLQNIPRKDKSQVKRMFASRFPNGKMVEIDFSQLEVVVQGVLSRDPALRRDLNNKVDFHCKRLAAKLGESYEDVVRKCKVDKDPKYCEMRTGVKEFSFQRAYGAGAAKIALGTGMSEDDVKALIEAEEKMYPGIVEFDKMLEKVQIANRRSTPHKLFLEGVAFNQGETYWHCPTGTMYVWREGITPEFMHKHGKYTGFSPTERKNYAVQGEGGSFVQLVLGEVFRHFVANDWFNGDVLLTNTVHDCIVLDGKAGVVEYVAQAIATIMTLIPELVNSRIPEARIDVPFPVEIEIGDNLYDMSELHS